MRQRSIDNEPSLVIQHKESGLRRHTQITKTDETGCIYVFVYLYLQVTMIINENRTSVRKGGTGMRKTWEEWGGGFKGNVEGTK